MRDSFVFYRSFYEAIRELPRDVQGEIYTAIMEYGLYGKETEHLKPIARSIFTLMKPLLNSNLARYENSKKGGAPKGLCNNPNGRRGKEGGTNQEQTENKPKTNQEQTENKPNVNVDVDVNIKEKELSNDNSQKESPKAVSKPASKVDLSFVAPEYLEIFTEWLDYKKARRESYNTPMGLKKCYSHLLNLSGNDVGKAKLIIEQSIANNYAGLFELKGNFAKQAQQAASANLGIGEFINPQGQRTYGSGKYIIPDDAPPRPGDKYFWNASTKQWLV